MEDSRARRTQLPDVPPPDRAGPSAFLSSSFLVVIAPDTRGEDDYDEVPWAAHVALPTGHAFAGLSPRHPVLPVGWTLTRGRAPGACRDLGLTDYETHRDWIKSLGEDAEEARSSAIEVARVLARIRTGGLTKQEFAFLLDSDDPHMRDFALTHLNLVALNVCGYDDAAESSAIVEAQFVTTVIEPHWADGHHYHLLRDRAGRLFLRDVQHPSGAASWNWIAVEARDWPVGVFRPENGDYQAVRVCASDVGMECVLLRTDGVVAVPDPS